MINEFDKEIDSLLRKTARGGGGLSKNLATVSSAHVDADEISLFAENELPSKSRPRVTGHLADCERCRKILSSLITLNSETESENVHAKETVGAAGIVVAGSSIPWYSKLLAFPQMAYVMGTLVLLFSAIVAVMFLQNARQSQNDSVAQIEETQEKPAMGGKGMSSDGDELPGSEPFATPSDTTSNTTSNATMSNSTTTANTMGKPSAPSASAANSNTVAAVREEQPTALEGMDAIAPAPTLQPKTAAPKDNPASEADRKEVYVEDGPPSRAAKSEARQDDAEKNKTLDRQAELSKQDYSTRNQTQITPDSRNAQNLPMNNRSVPNKKSRDGGVTSSDEARAAPPRAATAGGESKSTTTTGGTTAGARTRRAGGKTFTFSDGVWYDSAYNSSQRTTNVRRGSGEYKKLDSGLRSTVESLGGTVVIAWKGKAYRIN